MEKQKVWRTITETSNSGFFVWEVMEYTGDEPIESLKKLFHVCQDGTYIYVNCYHFFTKEKALEHMFAFDKLMNQTIHVV